MHSGNPAIDIEGSLIQAWGYNIDHVEIDLEKQLISELQSGPIGCRSYLKTVVTDIRELLDWKWNVTINYTHLAVNLTASILAILNQGQKEALIVHFVPPSSLEPAQLDKETYQLARMIPKDDAPDDMV